jgi:hypothetical protein
MLALILVLYSAAAVAQSAAPADAAKPPASAKSGSEAQKPGSEAPKPKGEAKNPPLSIAKRLQACLEIEDGTKYRLDCYDKVFPPKPDPKAPAVAKRVADCRLTKDEEARINCYNGFAESIPKF